MNDSRYLKCKMYYASVIGAQVKLLRYELFKGIAFKGLVPDVFVFYPFLQDELCVNLETTVHLSTSVVTNIDAEVHAHRNYMHMNLSFCLHTY